RLCDVDQLAAVVLRMAPEHVEGAIGIEGVARHQDAFGLLDQRAAPEGALEALVLREALQRDVDRALELLGIAVNDVGEDAEELQSAIDITLQRFAEYQSLQGAFGRRALIEQAKGILMARHSLDADRAFD